jgi:hypothetical protein
MNESLAASRPRPSIAIPRNFKGATLSRLAEDIAAGCPEGWPPLLELDFQNLGFIRPAGVVFLSNLLWWLHQQGTAVHLVNANLDVAALRYLDDSLFFEQHCGGKLWASSRHGARRYPCSGSRTATATLGWSTTCSLGSSRSVGLTQASFYDIKSCLSELFNNIKDHIEIGSIFVQHYPNEERINLSLADFGLGIPAKVRETVPALSDPQAVVQAVQEGFTSKSTPGFESRLSWMLVGMSEDAAKFRKQAGSQTARGARH